MYKDNGFIKSTKIYSKTHNFQEIIANFTNVFFEMLKR